MQNNNNLIINYLNAKSNKSNIFFIIFICYLIFVIESLQRPIYKII